MRPAFELTLGLSEGPALMHPGRAAAWWWTPHGAVWHDGDRLWVVRGQHVLVVPLGAPADVEPVDDGLVAWTPAGDVLHVGAHGPPTTVHGPEHSGVRVRNGADLRAVRRPGAGWRVQAGVHDVPLPEGAVHARDLRPWRRGDGVTWRGDGWVFRMARGRSPRALAEVAEGASFAVGPHGALLLGDVDLYDRSAAPGASARPLPVPLLASPWGFRWSPDGRAVAGATLDGRAVTVDLAECRIVHDVPEALPLDTLGRALRHDGTLVGCDVPWTPRETPWALRGERLGGPGGAVWDLADGRRCFLRPALAFGVTVPTDDLWATVDWESGDGRWIDPDSGKTRERFEIPMRPDDLLESGWAVGGRAVLQTAEGRQWLVDGSDATTPTEPLEPPDDPDADAVDLDDPALLGLPVDLAVRRGDRIWAWNVDGLLVSLPARARP